MDTGQGKYKGPGRGYKFKGNYKGERIDWREWIQGEGGIQEGRGYKGKEGYKMEGNYNGNEDTRT